MKELIRVNEPQFDSEDHYKILGLDPNATSDDIKSAYRRLTLQYHPDLTTSENTALYVKIKNAYETLRDSERRAAYDAIKKEIRHDNSSTRTLQIELDRAALFWRRSLMALFPSPTPSLPVTPFLPTNNVRRSVFRHSYSYYRIPSPEDNPRQNFSRNPLYDYRERNLILMMFILLFFHDYLTRFNSNQTSSNINSEAQAHRRGDRPSQNSPMFREEPPARNFGFFRGQNSSSASVSNPYGNSRSASNAPRNDFDNLLASSLYLDLLLSPLLSNSTNNMEMLSAVNDYLNFMLARSLLQRLREHFANSIPAAAGAPANSGVSILIIIMRRNSGIFSGVGADQQSANSKIEVPKLSENHQKLDDIKFDEKQIPEEFICPLSLNVMSDPVSNPSKGLPNVERSWILIEIERTGKNPFNNQPLDISDLQSNEKLKEKIDKFVNDAVSSHNKEQPKM